MTKKTLKLPVLFMALVPVLFLGAGPGLAQEPPNPFTGEGDNPVTPKEEAHTSYSIDGNFRVTWPSGCSRLKTRTPSEEPSGDEVFTVEYPVAVHCTRSGKEGAGCMVAVIFNGQTADGEQAGPDEVVARMEKKLQEYGAKLMQQKPFQLTFDNGVKAEGLDALGAQVSGAGEVWVRGFLVANDIYILSAWDLQGGVARNPDYITFFNSFQLGEK